MNTMASASASLVCDADVHIDNQHHAPQVSRDTFPFMRIPRELRLQIYSYLSTSIQKPIDIVLPKRFGYWPATIFHPNLFISRTIHSEAMSLFNDHQPAVVLSRPTQQQNYCALQVALRRGCELDAIWTREMHSAAAHNALGLGSQKARIRPDAVEAAVQVLLAKVPYGTRRSRTKLPLRLLHLQHFLSQTIIRLRRDPHIHLSLWVELRPYKRFCNARGFENTSRQRSWKVRDIVELRLLRSNLHNAIRDGGTNVTTILTIRGREGDKLTFEHAKTLYEEYDYFKPAGEMLFVTFEKENFKNICEECGLSTSIDDHREMVPWTILLGKCFWCMGQRRLEILDRRKWRSSLEEA
ncbi:hypothetical protein BCR34DRAFT_554174 [Clohesyomyces aquaticus]|uniref:F-box domain-containing protein n=1 Tax=Clohesyomyces aquaticus TaxID=1231657 RepID=A0A1Y2A7Y0_9PLEO|nr:hypothetical protein BCR34DRAFT_554174 [Clohesyomyces aquaticus]